MKQENKKQFCPNCEAETPCTHEAELFVCDICGEDFAKYIVSRKADVSDCSVTQDVLIDIKTPSSIKSNEDLIEEPQEELGKLRTDYELCYKRLAELEAECRWIHISERLPEEKQNVLGLDRTGTAYHWEYSKTLVNIFTSDYTHWMLLPELPRIE